MVIITGATGGIGKALTEKVLASGRLCCAIVRDIQKLSFSDKNLKTIDYSFNSFVEILSNKWALSDIQSKTTEILLVLNAFDITPIKMTKELNAGEISRNIEFNIVKQIDIILKSLEFSAQIKALLKIVNLDSGAAYRPVEGWSLYCAAKTYINMFLQVFSQENNIPVLLYNPGVVDTGMQKYIRSIKKQNFPSVETFHNYYSSNALHSPEEIAQDIFKRYILRWTAESLSESFDKKL